MKGTREKFEVTAGVRAENTRQGYLLDYPLENADPAGEQNYTDKSESERTDLQKRLDKDGNVLHTVTRTR